MIAHVVLFSPRADLTPETRTRVLQSLAQAAHAIPAVRRFRVGRRITHGLPGYEQVMPDDYGYAAIIEFDDIAGLTSYLAHPAHAALGAHFATSASRALAFDYEMGEVGEVLNAER